MRIFQVDAFTDHAFSGNPAGVCLLEGGEDDTLLQAIAAEMGCSETAFLLPAAGVMALRWFTPVVEVDLCGHATLSAAVVLWRSGLAKGPLGFSTRSGLLGATPHGGGAELDFPARPTAPLATPPALTDALGAEPVVVHESADNWLVELGSPAQVAALAPDLAALRALPTRGVLVTSAGGPDGCDFVSRYFAPAVGVDEDPVTGSAHCTLGPYWAARLGREELVGRQLSARGGTVRVAVRGERVLLRGEAVVVLAGELFPEGEALSSGGARGS
ncbi:MAG TPA: PhzF family phenazine biosynthesis protein [Acidimicrobiales bacterium]|nr:PhzF family phenazine biosynthesis protein [Acidimicrobiales bacterium]